MLNSVMDPATGELEGAALSGALLRSQVLEANEIPLYS